MALDKETMCFVVRSGPNSRYVFTTATAKDDYHYLLDDLRAIFTDHDAEHEEIQVTGHIIQADQGLACGQARIARHHARSCLLNVQPVKSILLVPEGAEVHIKVKDDQRSTIAVVGDGDKSMCDEEDDQSNEIDTGEERDSERAVSAAHRGRLDDAGSHPLAEARQNTSDATSDRIGEVVQGHRIPRSRRPRVIRRKYL